MSGDVEVVHDDADMEGGGDSAGPADEFVRARSRKGSRRRDADDDDDDDDELDEQDVIFSATTGVQDTQQRVSGSRISGEAAPRLLSPNATELNAAIVGKVNDANKLIGKVTRFARQSRPQQGHQKLCGGRHNPFCDACQKYS